MNTISKYGNELLSKVGMKTSSGDSISLPQSIKRAKFVKKFDMKVTTLQSYGLLRRDTPSPTQTSYSSGEANADSRKQLEVVNRRIPQEYPIDPNNVVASIHRNLNLQKQVAINEHVAYLESRDEQNSFEMNGQNGRDADSTDSRNVIETDNDEFVLDDDSVDSVWMDCMKDTCTLSVDDIYDEDELLGLAFLRDD
jgi:hypothetical protein